MPGPLELRSPFWWLRWVPAVVLAVLIPQLLYVAGRVAVVPVLASFALAYLVNPLVERFETRGLSRTVASIAALLVVGLMGFVFLVFVIPDLWAQVVVAVQGLMSHGAGPCAWLPLTTRSPRPDAARASAPTPTSCGVCGPCASCWSPGRAG